MPAFLPVEIAVQDAAGARIALEAGASRVELCQALGLGGLTPSAGLDRAAVEAAAAASAPRLRARARAPARRRIRLRRRRARRRSSATSACARSLGADGVVVGALTDAGALDLEAIAAFVDAAEGLDVTVHRAVDAARRPVAAVAALAGIGRAPRAHLGWRSRLPRRTRRLAAWWPRPRGALEVMAGGGVRVDDIAAARRGRRRRRAPVGAGPRERPGAAPRRADGRGGAASAVRTVDGCRRWRAPAGASGRRTLPSS